MVATSNWPAAGDQLFPKTGAGWHSTRPSDNLDWNTYIWGYKEAADAVVNRAVERDYGHDGFVFPALFMYRHLTELWLKHLLQWRGRLLGQPYRIDPKHGLDRIWKEYEAMMAQLPDEDQKTRKVVAKIIAEFQRWDAGSYAFRYPEDTKGKPSVQPMPAIDFLHLKDVMAKVHGYFSGTNDWVDAMVMAGP